MKHYLVVYMTEGGERGSLGDGSDYETHDVVKARTDKVARKKILNYYGSDGVRVYKLSRRLILTKRKPQQHQESAE